LAHVDEETIDDTRAGERCGDASPFATPPPSVVLPHINTEGPVRFLLVSGEKDDSRWGIVGAIWLSEDGARGGYLLSPTALWHGREMVRNYRSALSRGWSDVAIFDYWKEQTGILGTYMIDPPRHADALFDLARIVGAA
jgi:hypothetical protein